MREEEGGFLRAKRTRRVLSLLKEDHGTMHADNKEVTGEGYSKPNRGEACRGVQQTGVQHERTLYGLPGYGIPVNCKCRTADMLIRSFQILLSYI
jgi:hypothetical protein